MFREAQEMNLRRKMISPIFLFVLLASVSGEPLAEADAEVEEETPYSAASPLHEIIEEKSSKDQSSPFPRYLNLDSLKELPLVIVQPQTPISLSILSEDDIKPDRMMRLLQSAMARQKGGRAAEARQAKSITLDRLRSMLGLPFQQGQGGMHHRPPTGGSFYGWQQRIRNSLSSMNPFAKPDGYLDQSASHRYPFFAPYQPAMASPYGGWRAPPQPLHIGEFATAASMGVPTRDFSPFVRNPVNQHYFGPDLATSGSVYAPAHYAHYAASVPKHKPLFNSVGGLKGASLEISNAFADFAASDEHGPDVTQKFGSVGHAMNTFLGMMGLGPQNGLTPEDVGGFGGGGSWASMDHSPIARSSDFYPGYGNLANLDEMDDFPIFHEDITEAFMNRMNLTEFFKNMTKSTEKTLQGVTEKTVKKEASKTKNESGKEMDSSKKTTEMPQPVYVPAHPLGEMKTPKTKDEASDGKSTETKKPENTTESPVPQKPVVNYKVPLMLPTVPPRARKPPVAIYQNFSPPKETDVPKQTPEPVKPTTSQPITSKEEGNPNSLINDIVLRQWVPVSYGKNYVEKQPTPIIAVIPNDETPRGLRILEQVLSHRTQSAHAQA